MSSYIDTNKIINFGKYKARNIDDIVIENPNYCLWLLNQNLIMSSNPLIKEILENKFKDKNEIYLTFGKYKSKTLSWINDNDKKYIDYLKNNEYVKNNLVNLKNALDKING